MVYQKKKRKWSKEQTKNLQSFNVRGDTSNRQERHTKGGIILALKKQIEEEIDE